MTSVVLVDDHAMFRSGVRAELGDRVDVVGEAGDPAAAVALIREHRPDVVLLDVHMPDGGGLAVLEAIGKGAAATKFNLLSAVSNIPIAFMSDLSERLANRVQLSSDALNSYVDAVEQAFGADVDYGQAVKFYEAEPIGPGRYSPPKVVRAERTVIAGSPDPAHISTSLIERQNLTMRMSMRRFTHLTNGFSKKVENHKAAVALHFAHYNFVRLHRTLRTTPAMAAGVSARLWTLEELVETAISN